MQTFAYLFMALTVGQTEPAKAEMLDGGDHTRTVTLGETKRTYLVHVPAKLDPKKPAPVVLVMHGATMNGPLMQLFTGLDKKADEAGFIAVYPNGTGLGESVLSWNSGGFNEVFAKIMPDDVAYIGKVLDDLESVANVDKTRVFACGMSNGGMMCYRLAAEMSDRIAAIASVAGAVAVEKSEPKRPVPVLHFHGTKDLLVPYGGPDKTVAAFLNFTSVEDSIKTWVKLDGCDKECKTTEIAGSADKYQVTRKVYGGGKEDSEVVLYVIKGGGHTWPGRSIGGGILGAYTHNIRANDIIWEFFERHPMKK